MRLFIIAYFLKKRKGVCIFYHYLVLFRILGLTLTSLDISVDEVYNILKTVLYTG